VQMNIPEFVMTIIERLHDAGFKAYIVGGAVRDICLHRPISDWDVATSATPDQINSMFHEIRTFSLKHETVTLVDEGRNYEPGPSRRQG